ncbi:MAG: hypothetical protein D6681_08050 [Calditrichaeota bacterium]|nr:MAG: hypothetical protein D6681_08050 [Calditrichota bacterium]
MTKEKPRVLIDVDGVLRDFVNSLIRVYRREYPGHEVRPITSRKLHEFFPAGETIYEFWSRRHVKEILEQAPAYPDAVEALHRWKDRFEIVIVTAQDDYGRGPTLVWLGQHDVPTGEIHITGEKHRIPGLALLDDFPANLEAFEKTGRLAVCLDQPWNQEWPGPRVKTVDEFFRYVSTYVGEWEGDLDSDMLLA